MQDVFGEAGRHARSAVGVPVLPLGVAVEVDAIVAVPPSCAASSSPSGASVACAAGSSGGSRCGGRERTSSLTTCATSPRAFAAAARARGLPVYTWTVRTEADRARAAAHADQIIFEAPRA
jgi:hypothetical protein